MASSSTKDDGFIDGYSAGVSASAFSAVATFENPYARSVGGWDYGFLFRHPVSNIFHIVVVTDDSRWFHYLREGSVNNERLVDSGRTAVLRRNEGESNELRVVAVDDRGWFFVNGRLVATLDLSGGPADGDVMAFSGYFNDNRVAGHSTRFRGFAVTESSVHRRRVRGAASRRRRFIEQASVGASVTDFIATATFRNPYSTQTGPWDYGISFRNADTPDVFHAVRFKVLAIGSTSSEKAATRQRTGNRATHPSTLGKERRTSYTSWPWAAQRCCTSTIPSSQSSTSAVAPAAVMYWSAHGLLRRQRGAWIQHGIRRPGLVIGRDLDHAANSERSRS